MNYVQVYPLATPGTGALQGRARKMSGLDDVIDVNKNGERFVKEDARRDEFVAAIKKQPGGVVYDINDSSIVKPLNSFNEDVETLVSIGRIYKADSLAIWLNSSACLLISSKQQWLNSIRWLKPRTI